MDWGREQLGESKPGTDQQLERVGIKPEMEPIWNGPGENLDWIGAGIYWSKTSPLEEGKTWNGVDPTRNGLRGEDGWGGNLEWSQ